MRNATKDVLDRKTAQLEAGLAMLSGASHSEFEGLSSSEISNFVWLLADLAGDIRSALGAAVEVAHG